MCMCVCRCVHACVCVVYRADLYTIPGLGDIAGQVLGLSVCVERETVLKKTICSRY